MKYIMASQWIALVTMAVILSVENCESHSDDIIDVEGCEDDKFCDKKPQVYDKYQSMIDDHMENIDEKWRIKNSLKWTTPCKSIDNNCKTESKMHKPFVYKGNTTKLVVQSKFYQQTFMTTTCKKRRSGKFQNEKYVLGAQCLDSMSLENNGYKASCNPKQTIMVLYVYDINKNEIQRVHETIDVCCTCDISYPEDENY